MLLRHFLLRHRPLPERDVDRVGIGIEDHKVEVPHHYREGREPRLIVMDGPGNIPPEFGEEIQEGVVEPEDDAGNAHHDRPPDEGPVLRLLDVTEPAEERLLRGETEVVPHHAIGVAGILPYRKEIPDELFPSRHHKDIVKMIET